MIFQAIFFFSYCLSLCSCFRFSVLKLPNHALRSVERRKNSIRICSQNCDFDSIKIVNAAPKECQFIIANPNSFKSNSELTELYGVKADPTDLQALYKELPVIYIASKDHEFGYLGYVLNNHNNRNTVNNFYPALRYLRKQPVYRGGPDRKGSSFTMINRIGGFPDNRPLSSKSSSSNVFFSNDLGMANELCSTNSAHPSEFKFFEWSCVWNPDQLEDEHKQGLWITLDAPIELLFTDDDDPSRPLYARVLAGLGDNSQTKRDESVSTLS